MSNQDMSQHHQNQDNQSGQSHQIAQLLALFSKLPPPALDDDWLTTLTPSPISVSDDYKQGALDLLRALGVWGDAGYTSPMAYYFVRSVLASVQDGSLNGSAWQHLPSDPVEGLGARLVEQVEAHRLINTPADTHPTALRKVAAVLSVIKGHIKDRQGDHDVYLMQYDPRAEQFQPIGGKRESYDVDAPAALLRELSEELNLPPLTLGKDLDINFLVAGQPEQKVSPSLHILTEYQHTFFHVTGIKFPIVLDANTRWVTAAELDRFETVDELRISSIYYDYLPGQLHELPYSIEL